MGCGSYIEQSAFSYNITLKNLILEEGIEEIGEGAFGGCLNLNNINLPKTLKRIKQGAVSYCVRLSGLTLPDGLEEIGYGAFTQCELLTSIRIPDNVKECGIDLKYMISLQELNVPNGILLFYWTPETAKNVTIKVRGDNILYGQYGNEVLNAGNASEIENISNLTFEWNCQ